VNVCTTPADAAESDALIWHLVDRYFEHRENCAQCAGPLPCTHVGRAIDEVISWHHARALLSRAEALRAVRCARETAA
jgi:hypothetical protein